ncbi:DUF2029 domain-containing protein [bacterium]|nr:DUF2029 domain-containing protein [bacterium]
MTNAAKNLQEGKPVYVADDLWQHTKPPLATMLFIPLSLIDKEILWPLWDLMNMALLIFMALALARMAQKTFPKAPALLVSAIGIFAVTNFYLYEFRYGQYNMLTLAMILGAGLIQNRWSSGFLLVAAGFIKPTNILFLPWVLKERKRPISFMLSAGLCTGALLLIYGMCFGFSAVVADHLTWLKFIGESTEKYLYREVNYGIPSAISHYTNSKALHKALLLVGLLAGFFFAKRKLPSLLQLSYAAILSLALSPMTWWANFCILLPVSIWIIASVIEQVRSDKRLNLNSVVDLLIVYSGTQLIFPSYLPDFIMLNTPRVANPIWVYLFYMAKELYRQRKTPH